jgi:hypothetical protein
MTHNSCFTQNGGFGIGTAEIVCVVAAQYSNAPTLHGTGDGESGVLPGSAAAESERPSSLQSVWNRTCLKTLFPVFLERFLLVLFC